ncbi:hypothetical protein FKP32DRAFT_1595264 [Trametes sanguinea]|nr:hypothetical protein FKP32DRAFT_1595264 [Trametes sanguinea]
MEARTESVVTSSATARPMAVRHPHLYLENEEGTVTILVEDTLFKIHEYFLKHYSESFSAMLSLPAGNAPVEGRSDELPIQLPQQVKAANFERFLYLFYPKSVLHGDITTLDDWKSVLQIADQFMFEQHRELAIQRLESLATPIDRIVLSRQYDIKQWLEKAYYDLCTREEPLTLDEGERLGMADVIAIAGLRQRIRGSIATPPEGIVWYIHRALEAPSRLGQA